MENPTKDYSQDPRSVPEGVSPSGDQTTIRPEAALWSVLGATVAMPPPIRTEAWPAIPGYEILGELGKGGMGVVYKARDIRLKRTIALKMILSGQVAGAVQVRRFRREAEAAAHLDHPGIVPVYGFGEHEGKHFLALGLVDGVSLHARVAAGPLDNRAAGFITHAIAEAIAYAHRRGIVHRDLKPANILLGRDGCARVTDFGIARRTGVADDQGAEESLGLVATADWRQMTVTGSVLGTPSYMAPEQALDSKRAGPAADIYAIGAILYALLTGRPPFLGVSARDTLELVIGSDAVPPRQLNPGADRALETICLKCLDKDPERRYESAAELAADLERWGNGQALRAQSAGRLERLAQFFDAHRALLPVLAGLGARLLVGLQEGLFVGCLVAGMRLKPVKPRRRLLVVAGIVGALVLPLPALWHPRSIHLPTLLLGCAGGAVLAMLLVVVRKSLTAISGRGGIPWEAWSRRLLISTALVAVLVALVAGLVEFILRSPHTEFVWLGDLVSLAVVGGALVLGLLLLIAFQGSLWVGLAWAHRQLAGRGVSFILVPASVALFCGGLALGFVVLIKSAGKVESTLAAVRASLFEPEADFRPVMGLMGPVADVVEPVIHSFPRVDSESGWAALLSLLNQHGFGLLGLLLAIPLGIATGMCLGSVRRWLGRLRVPDAAGVSAAFLLGAVLGGALWQGWLASLDGAAAETMTRLGETPATLVVVRLTGDWFERAQGWPALVLLKMLLLALPMVTGGLFAAGLACLVKRRRISYVSPGAGHD